MLSFRIEERLGGSVHRATLETGETACVKVFSLERASAWSTVERFERSARLLAEAPHRGLPRVIAFEPPATLVREWLPPGTLADRVARERLDEAALRALLRGILEPLAALHQRSIAHGGVAPHDVMFRDATFHHPVLIDCDALEPNGDRTEDVRAAAATVVFARAHGTAIGADLRMLLAAMLDRKIACATQALRVLGGAPLPRARRRLGSVVAIATAAALLGSAPANVPGSSQEGCRVVSFPPATVYATHPDVPWDDDHPLSETLGGTPLSLEGGPKTVVLHASGYRPLVLALDPQKTCSVSVRLEPE